MTATTNDNALREQGEVGKTKTANPKPSTKLARVIEALKDPRGLNRFQAEAIGDHCLNSTIAVVRTMYPCKLIQRWETVPSRFSDRGVRVNRYWLTG